ncbi:MAG: hypothetical protein A3C71_02700 [Candidatus Yanofskybacteria bacterium RIFCSPHIGHO2_02_FULL_43_15c]|uniref:PKD domain-containing protein n=1 Tax=Candidatus Yanofskybacteria bacterium RIFCSPHIGHO2_02_FULL_43_15c TaxID=1802679 RepID=A0A1F8FK98_9BACT|nr:MAG: hypothetical protein A3C71_02700 [Candidatus Yanofskybacteria bacterium RIFCSPHIGHO2_02_FULL_43_15c]
MNRQSTIFLIIILLTLAFSIGQTAWAEVFYYEWSGSNSNAQSAGRFESVAEGFGLSGIGFGSDDNLCTLKIKTVPVMENGTLDWDNRDRDWGFSHCGNGGGNDSSNPQIDLHSLSSQMMVGWSWGANTSGGKPGDRDNPADECYFQQYMDLATKEQYGWGAPLDGSCGDRGYQPGWLKNTIYAPAGSVIFAIGMSLGDDGDVSYLGVYSREVPAFGSTGGGLTPTPTPAIDAFVGSDPSQKSITLTYNKSTQTADFSPANFLTVKNTGATGSSLDWRAERYFPMGSTTGEFVAVSPTSGSNVSSDSTDTVSLSQTISSNIEAGTYENAATITFIGTDHNQLTVEVDRITLPVTLVVAENLVGQIDIKCKGPNESSPVNGPCDIPQGQSATISWSPAVSGYRGCTMTRDGASLGFKENSGSLVTPVNNVSSETTYTYNIVCSDGAGGLTNDSVSVKYLAANSVICDLKGNSSAGPLIITKGQSVNWSVTSFPTNFKYFWHTSGSSTQTDVPGEGNGKTNWSGSYTYNTTGKYEVFVHVEANNRHDACQSNKVSLTVEEPIGGGEEPEAGVCNGHMGTSPVCYTDSPAGASQVPSGAVFLRECGENFDPNWSGAYYCPAGTYWSGTACEAGTCPENRSVGSGSGNMVTAATDGQLSSERYQCGTVEEFVCEPGYRYDDDLGYMVYDPYCYTETQPKYCTRYVVTGSWQDPLNGQSPLAGVDLKLQFPGTPSLYANKVQFDCTDDGGFEREVSTANSQVADILAQDLCRYNSSGTYTARAKGVDASGNTALCYDRPCNDTAQIVVSAAVVDFTMVSFWEIPAGTSRYADKYDYNSDQKMAKADADFLALVAGRVQACPSGKDCDFNASGSVNIGDASAYLTYLKTLTISRNYSGARAVTYYTAASPTSITVGNIPSGYTVSPNPVAIGSGGSASSTLTVPNNLDSATRTIQLSGSNETTTKTDTTLTLQVVENSPPQLTGNPAVPVTQPNYCISGPAATVSWTYSDADRDPQAFYQVQIDDKGNSFTDCEDADSQTICEVDSGKIPSSGGSYASGEGKLTFGVTYKARVKVWDSRGADSGWVQSNSWATPRHAYPQANFTWSPLNPTPNQNVQFTDQTTFFDGGGVGQRGWSWTFGDTGTSNVQNPTHAYSAVEDYLVNLTATDKDGFACSYNPAPGKTVTVKTAVPVWKEVAPKP